MGQPASATQPHALLRPSHACRTKTQTIASKRSCPVAGAALLSELMARRPVRLCLDCRRRPDCPCQQCRSGQGRLSCAAGQRDRRDHDRVRWSRLAPDHLPSFLTGGAICAGQCTSCPRADGQLGDRKLTQRRSYIIRISKPATPGLSRRLFSRGRTSPSRSVGRGSRRPSGRFRGTFS
jgi:hypothetical protein